MSSNSKWSLFFLAFSILISHSRSFGAIPNLYCDNNNYRQAVIDFNPAKEVMIQDSHVVGKNVIEQVIAHQLHFDSLTMLKFRIVLDQPDQKLKCNNGPRGVFNCSGGGSARIEGLGYFRVNGMGGKIDLNLPVQLSDLSISASLSTGPVELDGNFTVIKLPTIDFKSEMQIHLNGMKYPVEFNVWFEDVPPSLNPQELIYSSCRPSA